MLCKTGNPWLAIAFGTRYDGQKKKFGGGGKCLPNRSGGVRSNDLCPRTCTPSIKFPNFFFIPFPATSLLFSPPLPSRGVLWSSENLASLGWRFAAPCQIFRLFLEVNATPSAPRSCRLALGRGALHLHRVPFVSPTRLPQRQVEAYFPLSR
jgi:hypothetical protein